MAAIWRRNYVGQVAWSSGGRVKLDLRKAGNVKKYFCVLTETATNTATAPTLHEDNILVLISRIEVVIGGTTIKSYSLADGWVKDYEEYGTSPELFKQGTTASTQFAGRAAHWIDFGMSPEDDLNLLNASLLQNTSYELWITWATMATLWTAAAPASFDVNPAFTVYAIERDTPVVERAPIFKEITYEEVVSGSGDKDIKLPTGNTICDLLLRVLNNSIRSDALCTQFNLIEDDKVDHFKAIAWKDLQAMNKSENSKEPNGGSLDATSNGRGLVGYGYVDLRRTPVFTAGMDTFKARFTVGAPTGTANVRALTKEMLAA